MGEVKIFQVDKIVNVSSLGIFSLQTLFEGGPMFEILKKILRI